MSVGAIGVWSLAGGGFNALEWRGRRLFEWVFVWIWRWERWRRWGAGGFDISMKKWLENDDGDDVLFQEGCFEWSCFHFTAVGVHRWRVQGVAWAWLSHCLKPVFQFYWKISWTKWCQSRNWIIWSIELANWLLYSRVIQVQLNQISKLSIWLCLK